MARSPQAQSSSKKRRPAQKRGRPQGSRQKRQKGRKKQGGKTLLQDMFCLSVEGLGLTAMGLAAIVVLLGHIGNRFTGTDFVHNLLPFAGTVFGLIIVAFLLLSGWSKIRKWLRERSPRFPAVFIAALACLVCGLLPHGQFTQAYGYYRTLVGGKEEAGRVVLAHQVYAAYRRLDSAPLKAMINRAQRYRSEIKEAAGAYDIDIDLLNGLAAAESSYLPRKSSDGGHGLFQITQVPAVVQKGVNQLFPPVERDMNNPRYNAFLGAATLRYYLSEMKDDLFLGLLAYNIGPANGGLRFIMEQYGVTDFTTIQPYLLRLPRNYPIRVLAYGLAFRIDRKEGRPLAYAEGKNALAIQAMGIPGQ